MPLVDEVCENTTQAETTAELLVAGLPGKHRPRVACGDGDSYLYIFGGEPDSAGTYPRHAAVVTDGEDGGLSVVLSTREHTDDRFFDVDDIESARLRITKFVEDGIV